MTVQIHTPTINEIYQAKWNLRSTAYLVNWSVHLGQGTRPLIDALKMWKFDHDGPSTPESLLDDYVELNPLAHAARPLDILDQPGDLVLDDDTLKMTVLYAADKDGNPVENPVIPFEPIPFNLIPPDTGIYYMVKTEEVDGKKYSFFRPCHPTDKPEEGETLQRYERALKPSMEPEPNLPVVGEASLVMRVPGTYEELVVLREPHGPKNFKFKY